MFYSINFANFWLYGWAAIGIYVVSTDFVRLLFGEEYVLSPLISLVIAINFYIVGMQNGVWTYCNTNGLFYQGRYILMITAAINLVASFAFGKWFGVFGILLATVIARLFTTTWHSPYIVFKYVFELPFRLYVKRYIIYVLVLVVTGAICMFICSFVNYSLVANALVKFLVCCVVPNAVFFCLFRKSEEFGTLKGFVMVIANKFTGKIKSKLKNKV